MKHHKEKKELDSRTYSATRWPSEIAGGKQRYSHIEQKYERCRDE